MKTAGGTIMPITGSGIIVGIKGLICEDALHTLLSGSQLCIDRGAAVILDSYGAVVVINDYYVKSRVKCIKTHSFDTNQLILSVTMNNDLLYVLDTHTTHTCRFSIHQHSGYPTSYITGHDL